MAELVKEILSPAGFMDGFTAVLDKSLGMWCYKEIIVDIVKARNRAKMSDIVIPQSDEELRQAREIFHVLIDKNAKEVEFQKLFSKYPYILPCTLPLQIEPGEIISLGRPGRTEPDFLFFQKESVGIPTWGAIELKRPKSRIVKSGRKGLIQLTSGVRDAIDQLQFYSNPESYPDVQKYVDSTSHAVFLGNNIYLFIIMGLSKELADSTTRELLKSKLPPNCFLIPYDQILKTFEKTLPQRILILSPITSPRKITIDIPGLPRGERQLVVIPIPAGEFWMGSPEDERDRFEDESPRHRVAITNDFYMGECPVTQAQWRVLMGENPSRFENKPNHPVERVSWDMCREFIGKLNTLGQGTFRLPTEAEWEYACRAGTTTTMTTRFYWGGDPDYTEIENYAWYWDNSQNQTHEVGKKRPNKWELYDMSGNVWEWCEDDWHDNYKSAPADGSAWIDTPRGSSRVVRGGCWASLATAGRPGATGSRRAAVTTTSGFE